MAESLPAAAQPDIIRAHQKDDLYLRHLTEACHEAVRQLLGPRRAMLWLRETRCAAELLYYGLTTGAGVQTLGEEYCDVLQAAGAVGVAPGAVRRGLLVLLQALGPYVADQLASSSADDTAPFQPSSRPAAASTAPAATTPAPSHNAAAGRWLRTLWLAGATAHARWQRLWVLAQPYAGTAARLHLALFYLYGIYYQWSKRATGVRYLFVGKLFERRPSYQLLGWALCAQLAATSGLHALRAAWAHLAGEPGAGPAAHTEGELAELARAASAAKGRPALVLQADGSEEVPASLGAVSVLDGGEVPPARRCPLCLSARTVPTATPCGHVFCWNCIAEWGQQKPECPLCRAAFTPSGLVPVQHADF